MTKAKPERRLALWLLAACLSVAAAGCGEDDRPPVWEYISPVILQPNCATASCHSPAAAVAGLDFSTPERGYTSLTDLWVWIVDPNGTPEANCKKVDGQVVCQRAFRPLVIPYNPGQSRLVHMLRARGADRMPPDRPLSEADILLVERWILNGAEKGAKNGAMNGAMNGGVSPPDAEAPAASPGDAGVPDVRPADAMPSPGDAGVNVVVIDAGRPG